MIVRTVPVGLWMLAALLGGCLEPQDAVQVADAAGSARVATELKDPWGAAHRPVDQAMSPKTGEGAARMPGELRDPFAREPEAAAAVEAAPSGLRDPFSPGTAGSGEAAPELRDPFAPKRAPGAKAPKSAPKVDAAAPTGPSAGSSMAAVQPPGGEDGAGAADEPALDEAARAKKAREEERARRARELEAAEQAAKAAAQ